MNRLRRFENPMLTAVRSRRLMPASASVRIESRGLGRGRGVLVAPAASSVHLHRQVRVTNLQHNPVFRLALSHHTSVAGRAGAQRIESRREGDPGSVREIVRMPGSNESIAERSERVRLERSTIRELAESTVERVIRRRQRIESGRDTAIVMRERANVGQEVARALERAAANRESTESSWLAQPAHQSANPRAMSAPSDLDRLTDQIVNRIDDRLIAYQERMGTRFS